jgi:hypothetical protein
MDVNDLHALRDGASTRRRRTFNPFIHLSNDTPLMQMLFSITRPAGVNEHHPAHKRVARKKIVKASTLPSGSMVSYSKERIEKLKPKT